MALGPVWESCGFNWALKYVKAPVVSVSVLGESVGARILGYFIFNEALSGNQLCGGALILIGIYLAVSNEARSASADN
jgi:drug/metabolite transporter (DMT)-like permease